MCKNNTKLLSIFLKRRWANVYGLVLKERCGTD